MATKRRAKTVSAKPKPPDYPRVLETFLEPGYYFLSQSVTASPSRHNGCIEVERYRITIEKIEEPAEVIRARIVDLWETCDNHHHRAPLRTKAGEYGLDLPWETYGTRRKVAT